MTLLEAILPISRAVLNQANSGGGIVNITKNTKTGNHRVHEATVDHAPVCGGGNSARSAQWHTVFLEPDCKRCAAILQRKRDASPIDKNNQPKVIMKLKKTVSLAITGKQSYGTNSVRIRGAGITASSTNSFQVAAETAARKFIKARGLTDVNFEILGADINNMVWSATLEISPKKAYATSH